MHKGELTTWGNLGETQYGPMAAAAQGRHDGTFVVNGRRKSFDLAPQHLEQRFAKGGAV